MFLKIMLVNNMHSEVFWCEVFMATTLKCILDIRWNDEGLIHT